jgi:FtsH-binding integral membrane protein
MFDGALSIGCIVGTFLAVRRFARRKKLSESFSLASLTVVVTAAAPIIAFRTQIFDNRMVLEALAFAIAMFGALMLSVESCVALKCIVPVHRLRQSQPHKTQPEIE